MAKISVHDFDADSHGARYSDVRSDPILGPALAAAVNVMNDAENRRRMREAVELYQLPPLAGVVKAVEDTPEFQKAAGSRKRTGIGRLKQAVGVGCKLVMAEEGFAPATTRSGRPDQARIGHLCTWFTTARRYKVA